MFIHRGRGYLTIGSDFTHRVFIGWAGRYVCFVIGGSSLLINRNGLSLVRGS